MNHLAREVEREIKSRGGATGLTRTNYGLEVAALKSLISQAIDALSNLRDDRNNTTTKPPKKKQTNRFDNSRVSVESPFLISDAEFWESNEGMTDERQFHSKVYYLVNRLSTGYRSDDLDSMSDRPCCWGTT